MIKNIELKEIWNRLKNAKSVVLMPHVRPDGDAVGSGIALCLALRAEGVDCWVYSENSVPYYLQFLNTEVFTDDFNKIRKPEICVAIDCSDENRLEGRFNIYDACAQQFTIDHHYKETGFGNAYYIDDAEPAVCGIIYRMLDEAKVDFTKDMLDALYTGISTDTGNFKHSNTSPEVMRIAADLLERGSNHRLIMINIYENLGYANMLCKCKGVEKAELFADGNIAMSYLDKSDLDEIGAAHGIDVTNSDADDVIDYLRDIQGVETAAFLLEKEDGKTKLSMRSKSYLNVAAIAKDLGGGGHVLAAGATLDKPIKEAFEIVKKALMAALK